MNRKQNTQGQRYENKETRNIMMQKCLADSREEECVSAKFDHCRDGPNPNGREKIAREWKVSLTLVCTYGIKYSYIYIDLKFTSNVS
jgi:hypothetical protein